MQFTKSRSKRILRWVAVTRPAKASACRRILRDEAKLEMFREELELKYGEELNEIGDGEIVDALIRLVEFIIENMDSIVALIELIIGLFTSDEPNVVWQGLCEWRDNNSPSPVNTAA